MITWATIDSEVEEFQNGYRSGFVAIFKNYEGMETDERTAQNKVVKVTVPSFARRYGIAETTFRAWVASEESATSESSSKRSPIKESMERAAAQARTEAEARAAKELAAALERQQKAAEQAQREALLKAKQEAERNAKAEADRIRKEEQAKAKAAAEKEIAELKSKLAKAASEASFDVSTMTEAQKAQVMTMLANDPEKAKEWFSAQTAERARKLAEAEKAAKEAAARKQKQMEERESRQAAERARKDYDGSALKAFIAVAKYAKELRQKLREKPITFDHILTSGMSAQEWVAMTEAVEDMAVEYREAIFAVNAQNELSEIHE